MSDNVFRLPDNKENVVIEGIVYQSSGWCQCEHDNKQGVPSIAFETVKTRYIFPIPDIDCLDGLIKGLEFIKADWIELLKK